MACILSHQPRQWQWRNSSSNNADTVEAANTMRRQMSAKHRKQTKPTSSDLASAIQAILASTDLTAKAKNAAILALSTKPMLPDN